MRMHKVNRLCCFYITHLEFKVTWLAKLAKTGVWMQVFSYYYYTY